MEYTTSSQRRALRKLSEWDLRKNLQYMPQVLLAVVHKERWNGAKCCACVHYEECAKFKCVPADSPYCHRSDIGFKVKT